MNHTLQGRLARWLVGLPAAAKSGLAIAADTVVLLIVAATASWVHSPPDGGASDLLFIGAATGLSVLALLFLGAYRAITRFVTVAQFLPLAAGCLIGGAGAAALLALMAPEAQDAERALMYATTSGLALIVMRAVAAELLRPVRRSTNGSDRAVIYGAGSAGSQLAAALQLSGRFRPVAFVDDDPRVQGRSLLGVPVLSPASLEQLRRAPGFDRVLVAMPSVNGVRRRQILERLANLGVRIMVMPSLESLANGLQQPDELQEVQMEDLLSRESVPPNPYLLERHIRDRVVMVTGAAGSIGSELCRQALRCGARKLVLLDQSEYGLYQLERELRAVPAACDLVPELANVCDQGYLGRVIRREAVDSVFHAAAYKHVPMVEQNALSAIANNVFGTLAAVLAAIECEVANFVLVSTDKAVRPTSIMGASKRVCELIVQALATREPRTGLSIVRFGNVLASSGSVIPLFRQQIASGGPVTVTHPQVTRYFMTIPEAAQLVIQAGAMGGKGEVFVLDMGQPVAIRDLAERMIRLSGLQVRSDENPEGDIAIEITGLRPGEKLHEELLIGDRADTTEHSRIFKASERSIRWDELELRLGWLRVAIGNHDGERARHLVHEIAAEASRAPKSVVRPQLPEADPAVAWQMAVK